MFQDRQCSVSTERLQLLLSYFHTLLYNSDMLEQQWNTFFVAQNKVIKQIKKVIMKELKSNIQLNYS